MNRATRIAAVCILALAIILPGCASYRPQPAIPPDKIKNQMIDDLSKPTLLSDYNNLPQSTKTEIESKVARRNQIIQELIWVTDQNYGTFEDSYYGADANTNFWGDTLNLGLTGVSSVTGTAHLKSVLSAVATGTTGIKTSYLKSFYDGQTRVAIVQQMRASRAAQLATLQDATHMKASVVPTTDASGNSVPPYSLEQGLADADAYFNAGTIIGALQTIAQSAGATQKKAAEDQKTNSGTPQLF